MYHTCPFHCHIYYTTILVNHEKDKVDFGWLGWRWREAIMMHFLYPYFFFLFFNSRTKFSLFFRFTFHSLYISGVSLYSLDLLVTVESFFAGQVLHTQSAQLRRCGKVNVIEEKDNGNCSSLMV